MIIILGSCGFPLLLITKHVEIKFQEITNAFFFFNFIYSVYLSLLTTKSHLKLPISIIKIKGSFNITRKRSCGYLCSVMFSEFLFNGTVVSWVLLPTSTKRPSWSMPLFIFHVNFGCSAYTAFLVYKR